MLTDWEFDADQADDRDPLVEERQERDREAAETEYDERIERLRRHGD